MIMIYEVHLRGKEIYKRGSDCIINISSQTFSSDKE
jgi:hypothetical protein